MVLLRHLSPAIAWLLLILLLTGMPAKNVPEISFWDLFSVDKLAHTVIYTIFVHLLMVGFAKQRKLDTLYFYCIEFSMGIGMFFAIFTELMQGTIFATRSFEWLDLLANFFGCMLGIVMFRYIYGKKIFEQIKNKYLI